MPATLSKLAMPSIIKWASVIGKMVRKLVELLRSAPEFRRSGSFQKANFREQAYQWVYRLREEKCSEISVGIRQL